MSNDKSFILIIGLFVAVISACLLLGVLFGFGGNTGQDGVCVDNVTSVHKHSNSTTKRLCHSSESVANPVEQTFGRTNGNYVVYDGTELVSHPIYPVYDGNYFDSWQTSYEESVTIRKNNSKVCVIPNGFGISSVELGETSKQFGDDYIVSEARVCFDDYGNGNELVVRNNTGSVIKNVTLDGNIKLTTYPWYPNEERYATDGSYVVTSDTLVTHTCYRIKGLVDKAVLDGINNYAVGYNQTHCYKTDGLVNMKAYKNGKEVINKSYKIPRPATIETSPENINVTLRTGNANVIIKSDNFQNIKLHGNKSLSVEEGTYQIEVQDSFGEVVRSKEVTVPSAD